MLMLLKRKIHNGTEEIHINYNNVISMIPDEDVVRIECLDKTSYLVKDTIEDIYEQLNWMTMTREERERKIFGY